MEWEEIIEDKFQRLGERVKALETIRGVRAWVDKIILGAIASALITKLLNLW